MMTGIVSDSVGDIYALSERWNAAFRVSAGGVVTRVAGTGGLGDTDQEGPALAAGLTYPHGLAIDAAGNLFIGDSINHLVRRVNRDGVMTIVAGSILPSPLGDDGPATHASLNYPDGLAVDSSGNLFIVDTWDARVRKVDAAGTITTVAGNGVTGYSGDGGPATGAQINQATAIAVDAAGDLYIADTGNQRIRKVSANGTITTVAGNGTAGYSGDGGPAAVASLNSPGGVAIDAGGNLYIADMSNNRIRVVNQRGIIGTVAGNGVAGFAGDGGAATSAALNAPNGVTFDRSGILYIADRGNQRIRSVSGGIIRTFAGEFHGDGAPGVFAQLIAPSAVTQDKSGNLYATDAGGNSVRKIAPDGTITTLAGTGAAGSAGDGGPAIAAQLNQPGGIAVDASGAVFIADTGNNRIRKVSTGGTITTVQGGDGTADDERLAAPRGLFFEASGNLLIADSGNGLVRRMDTSGTVTTVAGNRDSVPIGDGGPATAAKLGAPWAVAEDTLGNLYIADNLWNSIRKVDAQGTITSVQGLWQLATTGDGESGPRASLVNLSGVAVDSLGNLYFGDANDQRIWVLNRAGVVNLLAGNGSEFGSPVEGADPAQSPIGSPTGLFLGRSGNLYFGDSLYGTIQVLTPGGLQPVLALRSIHGDISARPSGSYDITVSNSTYAGPTSGTITFTAVPTAGLNLVSLSGVGWTCSSNRCTRGDALAGGNSYPPVTAEVSVESSAGNQATLQFSVSGGGAISTGIEEFTGLRMLRPPRVRPDPVPHGH
jgi:sugar lactone lactonase YvrE